MTHPSSTTRPNPKWKALWAAAQIILLGLVGVLVFMVISAAVIDTRPVLELDNEIAQTIHDAGDTPFTDVFEVITELGGEGMLVPAAVLALALLVGRKWPHLLAWVLAIAGGEVLNAALKDWFQRSRPAFPDWVNPLTSYGYPSGHTMRAMLVYGMLAVFAYRITRTSLARSLIIDLAGVMVILVGFSRVVINAHFLSDVIGGLVVGGLWLAVSASVLVVLKRPHPPIPAPSGEPGDAGPAL